MPGVDERLVVAYARFGKSLEAHLTQHISQAGLTATQFTVLELLFHKGPSTVNEVVEGVLSSSGNIGVVIDNLLKAGLVEKKANPADARSRLVELTSSGRSKIEDYYPRHKRELQRCFKGVEHEEKCQLIKLLGSLRKQIEHNLG